MPRVPVRRDPAGEGVHIPGSVRSDRALAAGHLAAYPLRMRFPRAKGPELSTLVTTGQDAPTENRTG
jgi:hypothetical protein